MRKNPWIKALWAAGAALIAYIISLLAQGNPAAVEKFYARGFYRAYAQAVSTVTGLLPVSLTELALLIGLPALLAVSVWRLVRRRSTWQRFVSGALALACGLYALFTLGWGLNYSRLPYGEIAGLETQAVELDKVEELTRVLAKQANALRAELMEGDEAFKLTGSRRDVMRAVGAAYARAGEKYPWLSGHYGNPKLAILSTPLAYLNIAGIFSPFTIEAHVNNCESDVLLAATAMHEAAHLRGFAREDEANFIAYQVCMESEETYVRYSGPLLGLIYAGNALAEADRERYFAVYDTYSPGVVSDLRAYNESWKPYEGKAAEVHEQVNDLYLKANRQTDGVKSYGRMVDLMIAQKTEESELAWRRRSRGRGPGRKRSKCSKA